MKKKSLIPLLLLGTSGTFYALGKRKPQARARERTPAVRTDLSPESISQSDIVMQHYMRFFVLPLWLVPGFFDYLGHRLRLEDAPKGYEIFLNKTDNCIKVVLQL
ncbi:MAG TPA: hypothetical protein VKJ47_18340 [Candidatus Binatia bacterium]|nr:hypothetical protein [Candidatus Binatia bacterium]